MTKNGKNRKISAAVVLLPLMLIFAMFMVSSCDWLFEDSLDTTSLKSTITEARGVLNSTDTSSDGSDVDAGKYWATDAAKNSFQGAISIAEGVLSTATTQDDIDSAEASLRTAINTFKGQRKIKEAQGNKTGNTITITNIPNTYFEHRVNVYLISSTNDLYSEVLPPVSGYYGSVNNSSITLELFSSITEEPWTGTGSYYVYVSLSSQDYENYYSYVSKNQVTFGTNPSINFSTGFNVFNWGGEEGKTITITNIPNKYHDGSYEINVYLFESNTNIFFSSYFSTAYGYNYIDGSSMTVELYEPVSYDLWTGTGSYYVVVSFADYYSPLENFISNNKVSFTENPTINFNTELQKYDDFAPPVNTVILDKNIWESGYLSYNEPVVWYRFEVEKNKDYEIFINDSDWDNDYYKADVLMDIYLNGVKIKSRLDIGFDYNTGDFTADESGTVHVRVYLVDFDSSGSFDIGYNTSGDRSKLEWPLTGFLWMSGNFEHSDVVFFSFQAEAGKTYNIWWEDFDTDEDKIDVKVSVYLITSTGETTICEDEGVSTNDISFKGPGYVLIAVTALDPGDAISENFEIAYSTDGKKPIRGM